METVRPFEISSILSSFPEAVFKGNPEWLLTGVRGFRDLPDGESPQYICWVSDAKIEKFPSGTKTGLLILSEKAFQKLSHASFNFFVCEKPRSVFQKLIKLKFAPVRKTGIESTAFLHPSVAPGKDCYIGHNVVIEENVKIGNNVSILHNTVILANTVIGNHVSIGCNNTIGDRGFGYEKDESGNYEHIEHIGNVVIENDVEIHDNTCICRAMMGSTIIRENVKIDNLVHIAHGVEIGRNSLVIANSMIAGSVKIGENCWIAPSASILNQLEIGNDSIVGMGAVVIKPAGSSSKLVGNPAREIQK